MIHVIISQYWRVQMTSRACSVCDAGGARPFPSDKELTSHVVSAHRRRLCSICLQVSLRSVGCLAMTWRLPRLCHVPAVR